MTLTGGHVTGKPNSLQEAEIYCSAGDGKRLSEIGLIIALLLFLARH